MHIEKNMPFSTMTYGLKNMHYNVFVCFSTFHIFIAYYGLLGYIAESSWTADILCSTNVPAFGTLHGLLIRKQFHHFKQLHHPI